jgi:hypothetical protein
MVYSPISMGHPIAEVGAPHTWADWKELDLAILESPRCEGVIVLTIVGWDKSEGVRAEIAAAKALGKPVLYLDPLAWRVKEDDEDDDEDDGAGFLKPECSGCKYYFEEDGGFKRGCSAKEGECPQEIRSKKDATKNIPDKWWLISDAQKKAWGAFGSPESAWSYLFGRVPSRAEIKRHMAARWRVVCCEWPQGDIDVIPGGVLAERRSRGR